MKRKIIAIDEERCTGCGLCVKACHEGAIGLENGKAKLLRDDFCDGFGDCLPACPADAIHFIEREAAAYDEAAVQANKRKQPEKAGGFVCPGSMMQSFRNRENSGESIRAESCLSQWPVQIRLVSPYAPYFRNAGLLIAADCTAYAYGNFHYDFIRGNVTLIGCPKLDDTDYTEKLTEIFTINDIQKITLTRMTVPCCGGLEYAVKRAVAASGKDIPVEVAVISPDGQIVEIRNGSETN